MSWFSSPSKMADADKGRLCFKAFHNYSASNFPSYQFRSLDDLITTVKSQKGARFVDEYLGSLANSLGLSDGDLKVSMEDLAQKTSGGIPANWMTWGQALEDKVQDYSILDAAIYTSKESAKDIIGGIAEAGDSAIFTLKVMKYLVPAIIIGGVAWISYSKIRGVAGR